MTSKEEFIRIVNSYNGIYEEIFKVRNSKQPKPYLLQIPKKSRTETTHKPSSPKSKDNLVQKIDQNMLRQEIAHWHQGVVMD